MLVMIPSIARVFFFEMTKSTWFANLVLSFLGGFISYRIILEYIPIFIQRKLYGRDRCKVNVEPVAEPVGVVSAAVYLIIMFLFIPFLFYEWASNESPFPHEKLLIFMSAIVGICCAILLGFADDMLDLRWRHKLLFPTLSSLPLLLVYYATGSSTTIIVPSIVRKIIPVSENIDIGFLYYLYMGIMIVFCTNAINILAGINGLEAGQALIIAISIALFNIIQLIRLETEALYHSLSLYFLLPFISTNIPLIYWNWYAFCHFFLSY
ncbi:unnamed protein product [Dracunculus medinensis]|uniref:UDP-N-acetylglucosamine--dolichyl-phosphate N-acetylglucosaminephosphotransferase n=1 Tax=Dracunculus medinensis TaxID=318479 RepID=A0A0N4URL0_DRAME|nr:unnamed protein product [Dracunculus medinensis]